MAKKSGVADDYFEMHPSDGELYYYRRALLFGQFPHVLMWRVIDHSVVQAWVETGEAADREGAAAQDKRAAHRQSALAAIASLSGRAWAENRDYSDVLR